ncbi:ferrochelatase [Campylobacter sp. MIT 21-1685]|uniref:ferrochelatase n=1 Tax=unclassified Campylobacter TaxID=2593542 RepID=UPI00224B0203|nr:MULTISPECIES: ferrochelatase [unclassified Campylobacter]MCX2682885.1 ferrochelatase [Campylobacter sp. MIT 21-1684]MCX2751167.1 ferrochelatase [Campylobacter sp. MIT 21-1682]MCX2807366.1 ferrochelatase [Campylobacter sp. MIT 21-1685]
MKYVVFLNMGGVSHKDECELFLKNMFNDPYILGIKNTFLRTIVASIITRARVKTMQKNYAHLGGKSPLNEITERLCKKLNDATNEYVFDFVNSYVPPFAQDFLQKYSFKTDDECILFPLYPHHSCTTVTSALELFQKCLEKLQFKLALSNTEVFYQNSQYNEMIIQHILKANKDFQSPKKKTLIFSAHSLPVSIIKKGDLYEKHIQEHFKFLKTRLKNFFDDIILSYQSKLGPVKWLGPNTSDILAQLNNEALIYPLSFCIDCSETVFELEIEYRKIASKNYKVITCPNDSDEFVNFILEFVSKKIL